MSALYSHARPMYACMRFRRGAAAGVVVWLAGLFALFQTINPRAALEWGIERDSLPVVWAFVLREPWLMEEDWPLYSATYLKRYRLLDFMLSHGGDPNARPSRDETLLHEAAFRGDVRATEILLKHGAKARVYNDNGVTPLHKAAKAGNARVAERLIDAGAAPTDIDDVGDTPLHCAARYGREETLEMLMRRARTLTPCDDEGQTPLHHAARARQLDLLARLIVVGADPKMADAKERTALDLLKPDEVREVRRLAARMRKP